MPWGAILSKGGASAGAVVGGLEAASAPVAAAAKSKTGRYIALFIAILVVLFFSGIALEMMNLIFLAIALILIAIAVKAPGWTTKAILVLVGVAIFFIAFII